LWLFILFNSIEVISPSLVWLTFLFRPIQLSFPVSWDAVYFRKHKNAKP
jgi:hypothetical protein